MESFIKEERVECGHRGSSARNSQVFSYCTQPSPRTSGCAVSYRGEGRGAAWLCSAIFHTSHPHLCIFLWATVVSIEITEAMLKSQGAGSLGKFTAFFSKCQQVKREGLGVSEGIRH